MADILEETRNPASASYSAINDINNAKDEPLKKKKGSKKYKNRNKDKDQDSGGFACITYNIETGSCGSNSDSISTSDSSDIEAFV